MQTTSANIDLSVGFDAALTELRFRSWDESEVNEFRWIGGMIDDAVAMDTANLTGQLTSLSFLP